MKFSRFTLIFGLFSFSNALTLFDIHDWITYKFKHGKGYRNYFEDTRRMNIYLENSIRVRQHNERFNRGEVSYRYGLNKYSDLTHEEFVSEMNGLRTSLRVRNNPNATVFFEGANADVPDSIDWRQKGAVTEIKDQGRCGSCWSFSTTGAVEGQHFMKTGKLVSLSEQNLIDCSQSYGNRGCNGGWMDQGFQYIKSNGGIDTEQSYPYEGRNDNCRYNDKDSGATVSGFVDIPEGDEDKLKEAIATIGPISVAIDASNPSFQHYSSGIYSEDNCSSDNLDHGVLAVGYGTENGQDYYIVKNSWSSSWGENGFIRMARNKNNHCGIASAASYPLV
ncbi:procathepsin L-like [Sitodiplosis mosellana]|uniref:procathepsin L-like n=1 Tax=Sitodiplosis mosellana TaxID=263140 RepID=UPI0024451360|nr:procathepsin L-like [Sitodiplosis mosellana]